MGPKIEKSMLIVTTPHRPDELGGLATFTRHLLSLLDGWGVDYQLKSWNKVSDLYTWKVDPQDYYINVHHFPLHLKLVDASRCLNFIHGTEILWTSTHPLKRLVKHLIKKNQIEKLSNSYANIFISEFSRELFYSQGASCDHSRDLVFANPVEIKKAKKIRRQCPRDHYTFVALVRPVAHKNVPGMVDFCYWLNQLKAIKSTLYISHDALNLALRQREEKGMEEILEIIPVKSEEEKTNALAMAHFNLLFSLDHRQLGQVEGFGLTVLEAGTYALPSLGLNQGGLKESIHHQKTGYLLEEISQLEVLNFLNFINPSVYAHWSDHVFDHTLRSHDLKTWGKMLIQVLYSMGAIETSIKDKILNSYIRGLDEKNRLAL